MKQLSEYFALALKAEIEKRPRGFRSELARLSGVQPSQISDVVYGRAYASEERRRTIASVLGWQYEEFLQYGECLANKTEYRPQQKAPVEPGEGLYQSIPLRNKVSIMNGGRVFLPGQKKEQTIILEKQYMGKYAKSNSLIAFTVPDDSMEPTLEKNQIVIVDTEDIAVSDGKIYVLAGNGKKRGYSIKRVRTVDNDLYMVSDNPAYGPTIIRHTWSDIVAGRVIWSWLTSH